MGIRYFVIADGAVDSDDSDCMAADTGTTGDDGDGGGCVVTGTVNSSTAAVNFLIPFLPFAGVYCYSRFKRRRSKKN